MTRGLSVAQINASAGPHRIVVPLIEMYFDSGTLRLTMAPWDITVGADTYLSAPIEVLPPRESYKAYEGMTLRMNGLDPAIIALMTSEPYHGRDFRYLKAFLQADSNQIIESPRVNFLGRMRNFSADENNDEASVICFAEHYDAELQRAMPLRFSDADQERLFPGDKGCSLAARNSDKTVVWPSKEAQKYSGSIVGGLADYLRFRTRGGG